MSSPEKSRAMLIVVIMLLLPSSRVCGQVLHFRNYGVDEGLPDGLVRVMEQGRDGYLWFGSQGGLCRFDGSSFRVYSTGDGLNAVRIRALHEDRDGQLWIGSRDHGLIIYDGE